MSYTAFNELLPDAATQAGTAFAQSTRDNLVAMRDMIASIGAAPGFNASIGAGTMPQVTQWLYKQGAYWIRADVTWTDGRPTKVAYYASTNSGVAWSPLMDKSGYYVKTITYDGSGYFNQSTWGATP